MFQLTGLNYKTLHEFNKNNAYKVEVYEKKKEGEEETCENYNYVVQLNLNNFAFEENERVINIYMMKNEEG